MLTDREIKNAAPRDKPYRLFDGGGMYLEVHPNGAKYWRLKYRFAGKEKRIALGVYPAITSKVARQKAQQEKTRLAEGADPLTIRKATKRITKEAAQNSFEAIARAWLTKRAPSLSTTHVDKVLGRLEKNLFPWIGDRPITEIDGPELLQVVRKVEARGAVHTAKRLLQYAGQIFRFGVGEGVCKRDIAADLKGNLIEERETHRAALTEPKRVAELLRAIDGYQGSLVALCALRLAPLVFVRPGELRHAEWAEIDLKSAEWNIPAEKMKMRNAHLVPLSKQAVAVLEEIRPLSGEGRYVFPSLRTQSRPISDNTINAALRRMGFDTKEEMTAHGFRAMARTILDEVLHFRPDFIEHQLAHAVRDPNGRAYNRTAHLSERRKMMQEWADYLDKIKEGAEVIRLRNGTA